MRAFREIFTLEMRRLVRSRSAAMLMAASIAWMLLMPYIVRSDGTAEGARELIVKYSLGGVFALAAITLSASGAASLSVEREAKRLALSQVRPEGRFLLALGRTAALTLLGAAALGVATAILACKESLSRPCSHVLSAIMESPRAEAERMYSIFMADPETPPEAKRAKKGAIMRLLTQRAADNYESIGTNQTSSWRFAVPENPPQLAVRLRFTNDFDMRDSVRGPLRIGGFCGQVSNITQAIVITPLAKDGGSGRDGELTFKNEGTSSLMLRPRKDIQVLVAADSFGDNLLRAYVQLVASLATLVAFAVFLGAGLGRPVAVFTCLAFLFAASVSEDVIEQYPDSLESDRVDRIGLAITRAIKTATQPVASLHPLSSLSADECVEPAETVRVAVMDALLIPLLMAFASGFVLVRRDG